MRLRVIVIESPDPKDFLDGVSEGRTLCATLNHAGTTTSLFTVVNGEMLLETVRRLTRELSSMPYEELPVVHLSMHGSSTGVELTSGAEFRWNDLGDLLGVLDISCHSALLVSLSTCHGLSGVEMAHREDKPPFIALVGPNEVIRWSDTIAAFVAFYHRLQQDDGGIKNAVSAMNTVLGRRDKPLFESRFGDDVRAEFLAKEEEKAAYFDRKMDAARSGSATNPLIELLEQARWPFNIRQHDATVAQARTEEEAIRIATDRAARARTPSFIVTRGKTIISVLPDGKIGRLE